MFREQVRAKAAQDIAEALSLGRETAPPTPAPAAPLPGPLAPHPQMPPQGALSMGQPPGMPQGMPQQRPAMSPLQTMPDFRSPPVAAALQGAVGREGPIGFADGGFVVVRR